ncbi:hypothetical protein Mgra_00005012 [Meloidogyne graminicola]|uniref:Uncharacterized protein n=1 Tax=Meloidogyne graminicola TaxID=189291 RepID=A0A8S9ZQW6_9BILA|nr:hypothetical protein Mgra_00005012 [Meloidogyne graminicola]
MINNNTFEEEDVEWIEVTDDEDVEEIKEEKNNEKIEIEQNNITNNVQINTTLIPTNSEISEKLPDELSSISAIESDEQSEEITIPTTKELLTFAANKVANVGDKEVEEEEENKEERILENIPIKIFEENKEDPKDQPVKLIIFPIENGKENNYLINNEKNEKQKAAEKEAERLLKEIGFGLKEENLKEINEENKIEANINEIKIQPIFYPTKEDNFNLNLLEGEKLEIEEKCQKGESTVLEIEHKEANINSGEEKTDEIKFIEVPPNSTEIIPTISSSLKEELNKPGSVDYLIPIENKEEKILTETIKLPPNKGVVRFKEENKEKDELDEYEQKLRRRSKEALELVDKICGLQAQENEKKQNVREENKYNNNFNKIPKDELKDALTKGIHKLSGNNENGEKISEKIIQIGGGPIFDVECVSVNSSLLSFPMDCLLLPNKLLLIVDSDEGFLLISMETKQVVKQIKPKQNVWRNPECVCLGNEGKHEGEEQTIFVLLEYNINENKKEEENTKIKGGILKENQQQKPEFKHFICQFSISTFSMLNKIETPKWLRERIIWNFKICLNPFNKFIYLVANTPNQGFLFELNYLNGKWIECKGTRKNSQFSDVNYFASIGPITELLLVETNRNYVQLISIYNSTVVNTRILGICERPGSLCIDNYGNLLIFDRSTSSIGLYSKAYLEKIGDLIFIERANCKLNARDGIIAILCKITKELRLYKYGNKLKEINKLMYYGINEEGKKKRKILKEEEDDDDDEIIREPIPLMRA